MYICIKVHSVFRQHSTGSVVTQQTSSRRARNNTYNTANYMFKKINKLQRLNSYSSASVERTSKLLTYQALRMPSKR